MKLNNERQGSVPCNMPELNFKKDFQQALEESFSLFPDVNNVKAEQKLVTEKVVQKEMFLPSYSLDLEV